MLSDTITTPAFTETDSAWSVLGGAIVFDPAHLTFVGKLLHSAFCCPEPC
jgi:hypothetical protein